MKTLSESIIGRKGSNTWLIFVPVNSDNQYFVNEFGVDEDRKSGDVNYVRAKNHWNVWVTTLSAVARKNINLICGHSLIYMTHLPLEQVISICKDVKWTLFGSTNVPDEFEMITYSDYLNMIKKYN